MNKILLAMLLVAASTAVAQTAAPAQTAPSAQTTPAPAPKKEMKDPAEYNAYMGAEQQTDDAAKISGFEAFLKQFPNSS
jgi:TolA-binding protein